MLPEKSVSTGVLFRDSSEQGPAETGKLLSTTPYHMAAATGVASPGHALFGGRNESQRSAVLDRPALDGGAGATTGVSGDDTMAIGSIVATTTRALSSDLLAALRRDYPSVCEALQMYEKAIRHLKEKYRAKETELWRCISVGEELLGQMEALKQRCEVLVQERDEALALSASAPALLTEGAHASDAASLSSSAWWEEKQKMLRSHEAACERYRTELQKALQDAAAAQAQRKELEISLERTTTQLSDTEKQLRTALNAIADCEANSTTKQKEESERQRVAFVRQLAEARRQFDADRETALAESMVELERLQRALVRTQRELAEQQKTYCTSKALREEVTRAATAEQMSLQRQMRILAEENRSLQERLQQREAEMQLCSTASSSVGGVRQDGSQRPPALASDGHPGGVMRGYAPVDPLSDSQQGLAESVVDASSLAAVQVRLREENAQLRQKLQEVARQGQDTVDEEHAARLSLQEQLHTMEVQSHILRTEVVGRLQGELAQVREQLEACHAHSTTIQSAAADMEMQLTALQEEKKTLLDALQAEKNATEQLVLRLKGVEEKYDTLNDKYQEISTIAQEREQLVVRLQREKGHLSNALRALQAQAVDIEAALTTITSQQSESTAAHEDSMMRVRDRCVVLEHEAEELRAERAALHSRLRDAEEAISVLTTAQCGSQEMVREAERASKAAEQRASLAADHLRLQQQTSAAHLAEVYQHLERAREQHQGLAGQLERCQRELSLKEETLRKSTEAQEALIEEVKREREAQSKNDEQWRERWRQRLAQTGLEHGKLVALKEAHIVDLQRQIHELRVSLAEGENRVTQLQAQRQELQVSLSDSLAIAATHKGRVQALEEELARTAEERSAAQRELCRPAAERRLSSSVTPDFRSSGDGDMSAAVRLAEVQSHLAETEAALCVSEQSRQRVQRAVLGCLMPFDTAAEVTADQDKRWDTLLDLLRQGDQEIRSHSSSQILSNNRPTNKEEVCANSTEIQTANAMSVIADINQCASAEVMRAVHNLVELLHDSDRCHWSSVRHKLLASCVIADAVNEETTPAGAAPSASDGHTGSSWGKRCADFSSALRAWVEAMRTTQDYLINYGAGTEKSVQQSTKLSALEDQVTQLTAAVRTVKEQRDSLQSALEEMKVRYSEAAKRGDVQEKHVEALRRDVIDRDTRLGEMTHRVDVLQAEAKAERAEWVSKWQEVQRHREAERKEAETVRADLLARVAAAEETGHLTTQKAVKESADALQQLRSQLQALRETSSATEVQLQQQVAQLTREGEKSEHDLRQVKSIVVQLEGRLRNTEETLRLREKELSKATSSLQEIEQMQRQRRVDGAVSDAFEQRALSEQVASLQDQLRSSQRNLVAQEKLRASEKAEMAALRKVNASLETRLAEVEGDRAPLREQLHSLLSATE